MISADAVFRDRYGLHPRSAMRIQQAVSPFSSKVTIQRLDPDGPPIDASAMIGLVSAGIRFGETIRVTADGADEADALAAVTGLVEAGVCHP